MCFNDAIVNLWGPSLSCGYSEEELLGGAMREATGMLETSYSLIQVVIIWSIRMYTFTNVKTYQTIH